MHSNVVCFTTHRLTHTTNRVTGLGKAMVIRRIDHLHNLRIQYDRHKGVKGIPQRSYYLHAPKYAGGLDRLGRTPTTINRLADMLREEASPAKVLELDIVAKMADLDKPSKKAKLSTAESTLRVENNIHYLPITQPLKRLYELLRASQGYV